MKFSFLAPLMAFVGLMVFEPASAQLIDINQNPSAIASATAYEGSSKMMTLKIINFVLYFLGLLSTIAIFLVGPIGLILLCFKGTRKAGKIMSFIALGAIGVIVLTLVGFALANTLMAPDLSSRYLY